MYILILYCEYRATFSLNQSSQVLNTGSLNPEPATTDSSDAEPCVHVCSAALSAAGSAGGGLRQTAVCLHGSGPTGPAHRQRWRKLGLVVGGQRGRAEKHRNTGPFYPELLLPLLLLSPTPPPLNFQLQTLKKEMEKKDGRRREREGAEPGGGTVEGGDGDRGIQPGFAFGVGKQAHK